MLVTGGVFVGKGFREVSKDDTVLYQGLRGRNQLVMKMLRSDQKMEYEYKVVFNMQISDCKWFFKQENVGVFCISSYKKLLYYFYISTIALCLNKVWGFWVHYRSLPGTTQGLKRPKENLRMSLIVVSWSLKSLSLLW